ncbi:YNR021W [Saccharomyces arboricola H-6]|uniref:YNR021W n=1 Tax=Saccharomyces arboricola (strain H-6 / AS 2.3317 / CBS 10644) TaxID=1160507 RepID=J8PZQ7_SACAR|nr:YNR021W [Saccharomyces arboricola H-6]
MSSSLFGPLLGFMERINSLNAPYQALTYEEQKAMTIWQRVQSYNWTFEFCAMSILILVYAFYKFGNSVNLKRGNRIFQSLHSFLANDLKFSRVGFNIKDSKIFTAEHQNTWFSSFATGRSAIKSINLNLHLVARSNPFSMCLEYLLGFFFSSLKSKQLEEFIEVIVKPNGIYVATESAHANKNAEEVLTKFKFVSSIVNKEFMNQARSENYFLSIAHTSENEKLPNNFVYMSDVNQLSGFMLHYSKPYEVLSQAGSLLKFISFTDLAVDAPRNDKEWEASLEPRAIIRCAVPQNAKELDLLNQIIALVVEVYDGCTQDLVQKSPNLFITNDILRKTTNLRQQELNKIRKFMKETELELAKEKKLELEKAKRRQLKASGEQEKVDQKMKEKRERRLRNKQRTRLQ